MTIVPFILCNSAFDEIGIFVILLFSVIDSDRFNFTRFHIVRLLINVPFLYDSFVFQNQHKRED